MTTRVYKYGARAASLGPQLREQMWLGHRYYNNLVEAENARRRSIWGADHAPKPPEHDCDLKKPLKKGRKTKTCELCSTHYKELRQAVRAKVNCLDIKPLRAIAAAQGLYWGTYLVIEQAFSAANQKTHALKTVRFRPWRMGQVAAVQIQVPTRAPRIWSMARAPDPRTGRRARNGRGRRRIQIRIGSEGQSTIWSEPVKIEYHRKHEGRVRWVRVHCRSVAGREVASVHLVCSGVKRKPRGSGLVAVDVSWRKVGNSLRIAWARDEYGHDQQLTLGARWLELSARADRIRAERDRLRNLLQEQCPALAIYRSCLGVVRGIRKLGVPTLAQHDWLRRDRHLWQYESGCRRRSYARRRDEMRKWVAKLRVRYGRCVIKDTGHKRIKETATEDGLQKKARRQGHHAAPGEMIELLRRAFGEGCLVAKAAHTTSTCLECGLRTPQGPARVMVCGSCGETDDRDRVSTQNMLGAAAAGHTRAPKPRKTTPRFAKRHAARAAT